MTEEKKKFIGLNVMPLLHQETRIEMSEINSGRSLLDFDSVIVNPELFFDTYKPKGTHKDVPLLDPDDSRRIIYNFHKIKQQLQEMLQQGKNIYVITGHTHVCYRYIEQGSSKLELFNLYSFLPMSVSFNSLRGSNIDLVNPLFKEFLSMVKRDIEYHSVINIENGIPILKIKGTDKVVAAIVPHLNGNVIFLPYFYQNFFWFDSDGYAKRQNFFNAIYDLNEKITKKDIIEYPNWIDDYNILTETDDLKQLNNFETERVELEERIKQQKERLNLLKQYKGVFTSSGEQLENIVKDVFKKMGFQIFPTEKGRTDVIAKYGDADVVMEIKGLTKSAAEKNAAQLEKWVSMFIEKEERTPKPLLIVNAFCDTPLEQRTEDVFPNQMLSYSTSRNHCLISTTQLLCLFIEVTQKPECKEGCINELLTTVGVYNRYSDYTNFIKKVK